MYLDLILWLPAGAATLAQAARTARTAALDLELETKAPATANQDTARSVNDTRSRWLANDGGMQEKLDEEFAVKQASAVDAKTAAIVRMEARQAEREQSRAVRIQAVLRQNDSLAASLSAALDSELGLDTSESFQHQREQYQQQLRDTTMRLDKEHQARQPCNTTTHQPPQQRTRNVTIEQTRVNPYSRVRSAPGGLAAKLEELERAARQNNGVQTAQSSVLATKLEMLEQQGKMAATMSAPFGAQ